LNNIQSKSEKREERIEESIRKNQRAIKYLELLRDEVSPLKEVLPGYVEALNTNSNIFEFTIYTPFWDVVNKSGELPSLLEPELMGCLIAFYFMLNEAKYVRDLLQQRELTPYSHSIYNFSENQRSLRDLFKKRLVEARDLSTETMQKLEDDLADCLVRTTHQSITQQKKDKRSFNHFFIQFLNYIKKCIKENLSD
jgi:hypothetical protein